MEKKSIFWELPYWKYNLVRHNLYVIHIEENMFDNVLGTIMYVTENINEICDRPEIVVPSNILGPKPKTVYTLTKEQNNKLFEWIQSLKFPDGYASNLSSFHYLDALVIHRNMKILVKMMIWIIVMMTMYVKIMNFLLLFIVIIWDLLCY